MHADDRAVDHLHLAVVCLGDGFLQAVPNAGSAFGRTPPRRYSLVSIRQQKSDDAPLEVPSADVYRLGSLFKSSAWS